MARRSDTLCRFLLLSAVLLASSRAQTDSDDGFKDEVFDQLKQLTEKVNILEQKYVQQNNKPQATTQNAGGQLNAPRIYFNAWRTTPFGSTGSIVTYKDVSDESSSMNKSTGIFTAPVDGVFFFSFNMLHVSVTGGSQARVFMLHNGNVQTTGYCGHDSCPISMSRILELKKGDTVAIKLDVGNVYDTSERFTNFIGFQLR